MPPAAGRSTVHESPPWGSLQLSIHREKGPSCLYPSHRRSQFQRLGASSALGKASRLVPRTGPCPTCHTGNPADIRKGYRCDECADREEGASF